MGIPHDDLNGKSKDPTGGPQGPFFTTDLSKYGDKINWKHICEVNKGIWLDDEKRVDYIDMFGSLKAVITKKDLLRYIKRLQTDSDILSKHGYSSYNCSAQVPLILKNNDESINMYTIDNLFSRKDVTDIQDFLKIQQKCNKIFTYIIKRKDYKSNKVLTNIVDKIINKNNWVYYTRCIKSTLDNRNLKDYLHLIKIVKYLPGYQIDVDKNSLLTVVVKINTNKNSEYRYSIVYNIYKNQDIFTQYTENNLFKTKELIYTKVDWENDRVIRHRKLLPYNKRFNKKQGCINYNSLSLSQIDEIIDDKELDMAGDFFKKIETLKESRKIDTFKAELTWNPDNPSDYLKPQI